MIDFSKCLDRNILQKVSIAYKLQKSCQAIINADCSVGQIKNGRLQIFTNPYIITRARSIEGEIIGLIGKRYGFHSIDWKISSYKTPINKIKTARAIKTEYSEHIKNAAKNCKHKALKKALNKLSKTLAQNSSTS